MEQSDQGHLAAPGGDVPSAASEEAARPVAGAAPTEQEAPSHTPGPWGVFHDHPDPQTAKSLALIRPANSKGYDEHDDIASVYVVQLPERAANARLIASAPDLLAFALHVETRIAALSAVGLAIDNDMQCMFSEAREVIAKATGLAA
jgi:hypothetical protein